LPDDRKHVFPYGFDLLELKGSDLRREPIEAERRCHADGLRGSITSIATPATISRAGEHAGKPFTQHLK
jgi:ATP-dependent DNA ligase